MSRWGAITCFLHGAGSCDIVANARDRGSGRSYRFEPSRLYPPHDMACSRLARQDLGAAERGYAVCSEEILINDISIAAPVLDRDGKPVAAVNVAVSKLRYTAAAAETRFAPLVIETAQAISG